MPQPSIYEPSLTDPAYGNIAVVQSKADPRSLVSAIQAVIRSIDVGVAIENVSTLAQRVHESMSGHRLLLWMYGIPALIATLLAFVGLYGVTTHAVSQRTQEIGIRMALGARVPDVTRMVMGQGLRLVVVGLAVGLLGGVGLGRVLESMESALYRVGFADPLSFASVAALLVAVAALACYLPARKAAKVDPLVALRSE